VLSSLLVPGRSDPEECGSPSGGPGERRIRVVKGPERGRLADLTETRHWGIFRTVFTDMNLDNKIVPSPLERHALRRSRVALLPQS
jgi:hypothetical protein